MSKFLIPFYLLIERLSTRTLQREPEPDLVMDTGENVEAYLEAGKIDSEMLANYIFHAEQISKTIKNCKTVVDLACGPATILTMVAELNPQVKFIGVDLSGAMLEKAKEQVLSKELKNVTFKEMDISNLSEFESNSIDGVISSMALHHLPELETLDKCFQEVSRILVKGGALYLTDFTRLKLLRSVIFLAYREKNIDPLFALDYERSLRAAFLLSEYTELVDKYFPEDSQVYSTCIAPIMMAIKTKSFELDQEIAERVLRMKAELSFKATMTYYEIYIFFFLGGFK